MARKSKKVVIWMTNEVKSVPFEVCKNMEQALFKKAAFERNDRYDISIGYGFPYGMPKYDIRPI